LGSLESIISLIVVLFTAGLLVIFSYTGRKQSRTRLRNLQAMAQLRRALGLSVEQGRRVHLSLGSVNLLDPASASAISNLSTEERMVQLTAGGDVPPVISSGDGALSILSQDVLSGSTRKLPGSGQVYRSRGQLTGVTPWSFAVGTIPLIRDRKTSTSVLLGHFGPESTLLLDAAERTGTQQIAGTDDLTGQAVMYAMTQDTLIGEEVFAVPGYLQPGGSARAGIKVQDVLRWIVIFVLVVAAIVKFILAFMGGAA
jgi:hypothetical protein